MALSGIFYGTTSNPRLKPQISWSAVQSIEGNYSDVTAKLQYTRSNSGYTTGGTWEGSLTINGEKTTKRMYMEITYGNLTTVITATARVYHDALGAKTITISGAGGIVSPAEASLKTTTISGNITLDTVPRATEISAGDANITGCATVVLGKKSPDFTHSVAYQFGSLSGYLTEDGGVSDTECRFSASAVQFLVPEDFYGEIPNEKSGLCTLTCNTYSGDTLVGSKTALFTATAAESLCAPVVELQVEDSNPLTVRATGDSAVLLPYISHARCVLTATARNGATLVRRTVAGQELTGHMLTLKPFAGGDILATVTDSRGYTTRLSLTPTQIGYVPVTVNTAIYRANPTADTVSLRLFGQCYRGGFGKVDNRLQITGTTPSGQEIQQTVEIREDNTFDTTLKLTGVPYDQSFLVELTVKDAFMQEAVSVTVPKGLPVFDWGEQDFSFHVPVSMPGLWVGGENCADLVVEQGYAGGWYYRKYQSGFAQVFRQVNVEMPALTAVGSIYASDVITVDYPFSFLTEKGIYRYVNTANQGILCATINGEDPAYLGFRLHSATANTVAAPTVVLYVAGFWR